MLDQLVLEMKKLEGTVLHTVLNREFYTWLT